MYTCPNGANAISKRVAVGGYYNSESPSNMLCLPTTWIHCLNKTVGQKSVCAVEYHVNGPIDHVLYCNMPCSLCKATGQGDKIMIPLHYTCLELKELKEQFQGCLPHVSIYL